MLLPLQSGTFLEGLGGLYVMLRGPYGMLGIDPASAVVSKPVPYLLCHLSAIVVCPVNLALFLELASGNCRVSVLADNAFSKGKTPIQRLLWGEGYLAENLAVLRR